MVPVIHPKFGGYKTYKLSKFFPLLVVAVIKKSSLATLVRIFMAGNNVGGKNSGGFSENPPNLTNFEVDHISIRIQFNFIIIQKSIN